MNEVFWQKFHVRWSDLDPNLHMRHTAYLDLCAAARFSYLESLGFDMAKFAELKVGPILFSEHINYMSEVHAGEKLNVNVKIAGLSEDGRKWKMHQEIVKESDGKMAASLDVMGAWFSVVNRKLQKPPELLQSKMDQLPRTDDFKIL